MHAVVLCVYTCRPRPCSFPFAASPLCPLSGLIKFDVFPRTEVRFIRGQIFQSMLNIRQRREIGERRFALSGAISQTEDAPERVKRLSPISRLNLCCNFDMLENSNEFCLALQTLQCIQISFSQILFAF